MCKQGSIESKPWQWHKGDLYRAGKLHRYFIATLSLHAPPRLTSHSSLAVRPWRAGRGTISLVAKSTCSKADTAARRQWVKMEYQYLPVPKPSSGSLKGCIRIATRPAGPLSQPSVPG